MRLKVPTRLLSEVGFSACCICHPVRWLPLLRGGSTLVAPAALPVCAAPPRANPLATPNRGLAHRRRRRGQPQSKQPHDDLGDGTSATSIDLASMDGEERGTAPNRAATREPRHPPAAARETRQPAAAGRSLPALSFFCTQKEMRH
jgi:hypothetical protein